tara:strand:+ start:83 stop:580 length:498 start_codon:yes stop_codon:yes gene_type:complete
MEQFLTELEKSFPECKNISNYRSKIEKLKVDNPKKVLDTFMKNVSPYSEYIVNKNESFFELDIEIIKELNFKELWNSDLSDNTKNAIWSHLNTLFVFGSTLKAIPENMMSSIEALAQQCAQNFEGNEDPAQLMKGMQNMFMSSGMMNMMNIDNQSNPKNSKQLKF